MSDSKTTRNCSILRNTFTSLLLSTTLISPATARGYQKGDPVPVTCLNRTIESGEHITDPSGNLQYIPFPPCSETALPLSLTYGTSTPQNCTITLTDPLFHLLEFYVHNDAPLSCRVPATHDPSAASITGEDKTGALGAVSTSFTPLVLALGGTLQLSHLHVANLVNVVVHTGWADGSRVGGKKAKQKGRPDMITTAAGYSVSPNTINERLVIGSELTLMFRPQWYIGTSLLIPPKATHATTWTLLLYMIISALTSATICIVYFRGVDLPRRLRFQGVDRLGGQGARYEGLPTTSTTYKGYGYGVQMSSGGNGVAVGNGYGYAFTPTTGKKD